MTLVMHVGRVVGQYRIMGLLGQGGMGTVYAAEHTLLGRPAAVKVLLPEFSGDQEVVTRFFNEARAATAVRHPGIIEIYDFGWHSNGAAYIVMERLEGESLAARSARRRMSWDATLTIARQIAGALAAAHAKGIIHRDLKPDNVFLVSDPEIFGGERIKLLDFGIAKLVGDSGNSRKTRTGAVMGTPSYMAPEQCRGVGVDHRADLYSLGCILFELCTGCTPFVGEGAGDVLAAHIYLPIPAMKSLAPETPIEVERLVQRLLAKRPQDRVQSADDVVREIDALMRPVYQSGPQPVVPSFAGLAASTASLTTLSGAAGTTLVVRSDKRTIYWGSAAVTALIATTSVIYLVTGDTRKSSSTTQANQDEPVSVLHPTPTPAAPAPAPSVPTPVRSTSTPAPTALAAEISPAEAKTSPAAPSSLQTPSAVALDIDSTPPGAEVVLRGEVLGRTPFRGPLPRGDNEVAIVIRLRGYASRTIVVRPGKPITQQINLVPSSPPQRQLRSRDDSVNPFESMR
jgi:serine/threonine-protein kinase